MTVVSEDCIWWFQPFPWTYLQLKGHMKNIIPVDCWVLNMCIIFVEYNKSVQTQFNGAALHLLHNKNKGPIQFVFVIIHMGYHSVWCESGWVSSTTALVAFRRGLEALTFCTDLPPRVFNSHNIDMRCTIMRCTGAPFIILNCSTAKSHGLPQCAEIE